MMISRNQPYVRFKRHVFSKNNRSVLNKLKAKLVCLVYVFKTYLMVCWRTLFVYVTCIYLCRASETSIFACYKKHNGAKYDSTYITLDAVVIALVLANGTRKGFRHYFEWAHWTQSQLNTLNKLMKVTVFREPNFPYGKWEEKSLSFQNTM